MVICNIFPFGALWAIFLVDCDCLSNWIMQGSRLILNLREIAMKDPNLTMGASHVALDTFAVRTEHHDFELEHGLE